MVWWSIAFAVAAVIVAGWALSQKNDGDGYGY